MTRQKTVTVCLCGRFKFQNKFRNQREAMEFVNQKIDADAPVQVEWSQKNCDYLIYPHNETRKISANRKKVLSKNGAIITFNEFLKILGHNELF